MESVSTKASRRRWERLIQKVYEVDPSSFGRCQNYTVSVRNVLNKMRIVAVITDPGECKHSLEVDKIFEKYTHGTRYHVYTFKSLTKKKRERGSNLPLTLLIGCSFKMLFFQIFLFLHPLFQERTYITYSKLLPYIIPWNFKGRNDKPVLRPFFGFAEREGWGPTKPNK